MSSLISKLPTLFQSNPLIVKLAHLIEGKNILFSSIVYKNPNNNKTHIINKIQQTPYFELDWQCYSFLRCYAHTLITTGSVMRCEKDLFKTYFACGDKQIEQMYRNFRVNKEKNNQKQNVYVMTQSMTKQQTLSYFNTDLYNVVSEKYIKQPIGDKKGHLTEILQGLINENKDPILIECGPVVMKDYFDSIRNGSNKYLIDGSYIAYFQGNLPQESIGNQFSFDEDLFETVFESQKIPVEHKGKKIGNVVFKFYEKIKQSTNQSN